MGGLTAAIALRKAGVDVTVFERMRDARLTSGRWGLGLWSNATRSLGEIDLADSVLAVGPETERLVFRSWKGEPIASWPVGELGERLGAPSVSVSPEALLTVLSDALDGVVLTRDAECVGFTQDGAGVTVRLADGREQRADFLIGADGLRSTVRTHLFGAQEPRYAGYWVWQSIIDFEHEQAPVGIDNLLWGKGARFAFHHVEHNRLFWQAIVNTPEVGDGVTTSRRDALLERYAGFVEPVAAAISSTAEEDIKGVPIYDRNPASKWGTGRVTLLGDAAHPMTNNLGQGACMAIEDAIVLARSVRDASDVPAALRTYEQGRMSRTATMVKIARRIGNLGRWQNPAAVRLREFVMRRTFNGPVLKSHFKLLSYRA